MSTKTIVILVVTFVLSGVQAIHAVIPMNWYALIVTVLTGIETFFGQTGVAIAGAFSKKG